MPGKVRLAIFRKDNKQELTRRKEHEIFRSEIMVVLKDGPYSMKFPPNTIPVRAGDLLGYYGNFGVIPFVRGPTFKTEKANSIPYADVFEAIKARYSMAISMTTAKGMLMGGCRPSDPSFSGVMHTLYAPLYGVEAPFFRNMTIRDHSNPIDADGVATRVHLFAKYLGQLNLLLFRKQGSDYVEVYRSKPLSIRDVGVVLIDLKQPVPVQKGDLVGFFSKAPIVATGEFVKNAGAQVAFNFVATDLEPFYLGPYLTDKAAAPFNKFRDTARYSFGISGQITGVSP